MANWSIKITDIERVDLNGQPIKENPEPYYTQKNSAEKESKEAREEARRRTEEERARKAREEARRRTEEEQARKARRVAEERKKAENLIKKIKKELGKDEGNVNIERAKLLLTELKPYADKEPMLKRIYAELAEEAFTADKAELLIKKIKNGLDGKIASIQNKEELLEELKKYADRDAAAYGAIYVELEEKVSVAIERNAKRLIEEIQNALNESALDIVGLKWKLRNLESYAKSRPSDYEDIYAELTEQATKKIEEEEKRRAKEEEERKAEEERKKAEETERHIRICIAIIGKSMAEARVDIGILRRKLAELKQYTNQYPGKYSKVYDEVEKRVNNAVKIEEKRRAEEEERKRAEEERKKAEETERNISKCIKNISNRIKKIGENGSEAKIYTDMFGQSRKEASDIDMLRRELAELKLCTNQYPDKYSKIYDETEKRVNAAIAREEERIEKEAKQAVANRVITCLLYIPLWFVMAWLSRYVIGSTWSKIVWVILLLLHGLVIYGTESDSFKDKKMMQAFFLVEIIYYVIWWVSSGIMKLLIGNGWSILLSLVLLSGCIITSFTVLDEPMGFSEFGKNLLFLIRKRGYRKLLDGEYMKSINDVAKLPIVIAGIEILLAAIVKFLSFL